MSTIRRLATVAALAMLSAGGPAQAREHRHAATSATDVSTLLAGRYDNSAQVAKNEPTPSGKPPQHVTITIQPTKNPDWQLWRVHMDVDQSVARAAHAATSLDAVWAINISRSDDEKSVGLTPYTLNRSVDPTKVTVSSFDKARWLPLGACTLLGTPGKSQFVAEVPPNERCAAQAMRLGGERAFLPTWIKRDGDWLDVRLVYFGEPWQVNARRVRSSGHNGD